MMSCQSFHLELQEQNIMNINLKNGHPSRRGIVGGAGLIRAQGKLGSTITFNHNHK